MALFPALRGILAHEKARRVAGLKVQRVSVPAAAR
jgi:hypothetical protein